MTRIYFPRHARPFKARCDIGSHPQFAHLAMPPQGYSFETGKIGWGEWFKRWQDERRILTEQKMRVDFVAAKHGLSQVEVAKFWRTRGGSSRLVPMPENCAASFLPTFPFTLQNERWFLEIEDVTTLFWPYILNGQTYQLRLRDLPVFPLIKDMLESPQCAGIMTHVESTARAMHGLFQSEIIDQKTAWIPVPYIPRTPVSQNNLEECRGQKEIQFFFNNSWHQDRLNFFLRGGQSILEAFDALLAADLPVRLIIRSKIPRHLSPRLRRLMQHPRVHHVKGFVDNGEYLRMLRSSHYFLLPAARIHVVSVMEAMYYGAVPIVSDGWGINEYVQDGVTGHALQGINGQVSWTEPDTGELREDYRRMFEAPGLLTNKLIALIEDLVKHPEQRAPMAWAAHRQIVSNHNITGFNVKFKEFLDRGLNATSGVPASRLSQVEENSPGYETTPAAARDPQHSATVDR